MRIGLIGCGRWGRLILRDLLSLGMVVDVAAPSAATRAQAQEAGARETQETLDALPEADGYVVAVPTIAHAETIEALLPRGRPIFVEKPMTASVADAERILASAPERVFCMDKWRYHGGVCKLSELARSGALGDICAVQSWRLGWGNPHSDVDTVWILAPHDLSIAFEILGALPPVAHAHGVHLAGVGQSLTGQLAHADGSGTQVTLEVSSIHPVNRRSVVVIGTKGAAQFGDSYDSVVRLNRPGADPEEIPVDTEMPLLSELRAFTDYLAGEGPPPKSSAEEAALFVRRVAELRDLAGFPGA